MLTCTPVARHMQQDPSALLLVMEMRRSTESPFMIFLSDGSGLRTERVCRRIPFRSFLHMPQSSCF